MKSTLKIGLIALVLTTLVFSFKNKVDNLDSNLRKEKLNLNSFHSIDASGVLDIYISHGQSQSVTFEAEEDLFDRYDFKVKNNVLYVEMENNKKNKMKYKNSKLYLTLDKLENIDCSIVGKFIMEDEIKSENVHVDISQVGNATLNFECHSFEADFSHVGNITVIGSADKAELSNSSVGNVEANDFKVKVLDVRHSGVGNMSVFSTEEISVHSNAVGNVRYSGDAKVKSINSSGIGKVKKA